MTQSVKDVEDALLNKPLLHCSKDDGTYTMRCGLKFPDKRSDDYWAGKHFRDVTNSFRKCPKCWGETK